MKKSFGFAIVFLCMASALYANGSSEQSATPAKNDGPVTIQYYCWDDACHKAMIDEFNKSQSKIHVDAHILPAADYEVKLTTMLSGGVEMDCFMEKRQTDMFSQYDNGFIEPLDDLMAKSGQSFSGVDAYKSAVTYDGHVICLPWRGGTYFLYYNKKIFADCGLPTPDTFVENKTWTWDTFEKLAKQITDTGNGYVGASTYFWANCAEFEAAQHQQELITSDGKIQDDGSMLRAFQRRKRMEENKSMWSLIDMKITKTHYSKQFYDGKLGMLIIGEWFPGQVSTGDRDGLMKGFTKADYGIVPIPCDDVNNYITSGLPTSNHVTTSSKKKDAAFEFISWMAGEGGAKVAASYGVMPAMTDSPAVREIIGANLPDKKSLDYYLASYTHYNCAFNKYGTRVTDLIQNLEEEYLLGKLPDGQFDARYRSGLQEIIDTTN
jgi:multiple sugar transport system substrate-binding protein